MPEQAAAAIGVLTLELRLEFAHSLKDKRQVLRSFKDRLRAGRNVAVAEIGYQDLWQRALLAVVTIASARDAASRVLEAVEEDAASLPGVELAAATLEWLA